MRNAYLDDFVAIDAAYTDWGDPDFPPFNDDGYTYDADGYVIECPNDKYAEKENK